MILLLLHPPHSVESIVTRLFITGIIKRIIYGKGGAPFRRESRDRRDKATQAPLATAWARNGGELTERRAPEGEKPSTHLSRPDFSSEGATSLGILMAMFM